MSSRAKWLLVAAAAACGVVGIAAAFGAFSGGGCQARTASRSPARFVRPRVPPGVVLHQNARTIEQRIRRGLGPQGVITSVVVVAHRRETARVIGGTGPDIEHGGPAWIVRARGLWVPVSDPRCVDPRLLRVKGYTVIDDKTGRGIAYGFRGG